MSLSIREQIQQNEACFLSPRATLSRDTKGRERPEEDCPLRTPFQRDRDRIMHCKAFRRLKHKTQVFLSPQGDHYRTRLTHTLEVSQVARTISRALFLNEDLTEAIALGHDLGHTPFGHAGERTLNEICPGGFRHYQQSIRVVSKLERGGTGLNLTAETLDGISSHSISRSPQTMEGQVVRLADKIAYINHDIDDAIRAGLLTPEEIPQEYVRVFGNTLSQRINSMITNVVEHSDDTIRMDEETMELFFALRAFLFDHVYFHPAGREEMGKAQDLIKTLYGYFVHHPDLLPQEYTQIREEEGVDRAVCDYVAGMSDQFALQCFQTIFVPKMWTGI